MRKRITTLKGRQSAEGTQTPHYMGPTRTMLALAGPAKARCCLHNASADTATVSDIQRWPCLAGECVLMAKPGYATGLPLESRHWLYVSKHWLPTSV